MFDGCVIILRSCEEMMEFFFIFLLILTLLQGSSATLSPSGVNYEGLFLFSISSILPRPQLYELRTSNTCIAIDMMFITGKMLMLIIFGNIIRAYLYHICLTLSLTRDFRMSSEL